MDYNIYIHSFNNGGMNTSPTTPSQVIQEGGTGEQIANGGMNLNAGGLAASFLSNPDSIFGMAKNLIASPLGKVGIALTIAANIAKKAIEMQMSFYAPNTGNFKMLNQYKNFNQTVNAVTHPFQTFHSILQSMAEEKRNDYVSEQKRLLTGGAIYTSQYGRYL